MFTLCAFPKSKVKEIIMELKMMEKLVDKNAAFNQISEIPESILFHYFAVKPFYSKANK